MEFKNINISKLEANIGQIKGLPANPRSIDKDKFELLKKDIQDYPEMLELRGLMVYPYNDKYVIIGGNMRLEAMKALGFKEAPCCIISKETSVEKLKAYTIIDNNGFGKWDFDMLANEWDADELKDWGMDLPADFEEEEDESKEAEEDDYNGEVPATTDIKLGDVFQLGDHRVMCGDSTSKECVENLLGGGKN